MNNGPVRVTARADYALRAAVELARAGGELTKAAALADSAGVPLGFLENILADMRRTGLVKGHRGAEGGYTLGRPATLITVADVILAVDGPLASVRGEPADTLDYVGSAAPLQVLWVAVQASLRDLLEHVTLDDLARGDLPDRITELAATGVLASPEAVART